MSTNFTQSIAAGCAAGALSAVTAWALMTGGPAAAQAPSAGVQVESAWARASMQGQSGTGAFMTLTASQPLKLVGVSSPVAGVAEVHEMKLEGDVMKMRPIAGLDLPAGRKVELKPGSYHVMLLDLKAPLAVGTTVPLTLQLQDDKGQRTSHTVALAVSARAPVVSAGTSSAAQMMDAHKP